MAEFELPEKKEDRRERGVGLIIAVIAMVLALVSSMAGSTHQSEILAHIDASDQYAFYQAKKERRLQLSLALDTIRRSIPVAGAHDDSPEYEAEMNRLDSESRDIQRTGDDLMNKSRALESHARVLDLGEIALQIAVVLCSITVLTEQRLFVRLGVVMAGVGVLLAVAGIWRL